MTEEEATGMARILLGPRAEVRVVRLDHYVGLPEGNNLLVYGSGATWMEALHEAAVRVGVPGAILKEE